MSTIGPNPAQLIAGISNAERAASKDVDKAKADKGPRRSRRRDDEIELSGGAEAAEAIRSLKDPSQEEARRDDDAKRGYEPTRAGAGKPAKRLDVSG